MNGSNITPIEILLVEDSPSDALLTKEALEASKMHNTLHHVEDGVEAMAYLHREGKYSEAQRPGLILLDINMPRKSGLEVLQEMKKDEELRAIPVIMLTTSSAEEDVLASYKNYANCFVSKPVDFSEFARAVKSINDFWFSLVTLPPQK